MGAAGMSQGVSPRLPDRRTTEAGRLGRLPWMRPPQSPQNHEVVSAPEGATRCQPLGWPRTIRKASVATVMFSAKALPDWRWQLPQWQADNNRGASGNPFRVVPHKEPAAVR